MKAPARIELDFAGPAHRSWSLGVVLCAAGIVGCAAMGHAFQTKLGERNTLEAQLGATVRPHRTATPNASRNAAAAAAIEQQLQVPWSHLLAELESASQDVAATVSLLEVQPDAAKHVVRITAEARTLPDALAYLERLQKSPVLRYPMLDSHELRKDDPEHPIRVKLSAEWRT
jgi:uncharacterized membrane protein YccC